MAITDQDTRERLLRAAERLLLEAGYDKTSIRAVCSTAGVNPAAVHYHFGSKPGLVAALLQARLAPVWETSVTALDHGTADVSTCVDAVVDPLVRLADDPAGRLYVHLLARLVLGRQDVAWSAQWFGLAPWSSMLERQVPGLPAAQARARWMLAFELVLGQFGDPLAGSRTLSPAAVATLKSFVTGGLTAQSGR